MHNELDSCNCGGEKWTIKKLHQVMTEQLQKDVDGTSFIPVNQILCLVLHLRLLGISNGLLNHFWQWIEE
jgi:hypothetical protein